MVISEPKDYKFLATKPKRTQMIEDRYTEIERANRILLEKMTHILANKPQTSLQQPSVQEQSMQQMSTTTG